MNQLWVHACQIATVVNRRRETVKQAPPPPQKKRRQGMSVHIIEVAWRFRTRSNHHHKEGVTNTTKTTAKTEVWLVPDSCGGCFPFLAMMEKVIFAFECSLFQSQFWRFLCFVGSFLVASTGCFVCSWLLCSHLFFCSFSWFLLVA